MIRAALLLPVLAGVACGPAEIFLAGDWADGRARVIVVADADNQPIAVEALAAGASVEFELHGDQGARFFALAFDSLPEGLELVSCGVEVGSEQIRLPRPTLAWATDSIAGESNAAPAFHELAPAEVPIFSLRFSRCLANDPFDCRLLSPVWASHAPLPDYTLNGIAVIDEDLLFYSGHPGALPGPPALVRFDHGQHRQVPIDPAIEGRIGGLAFDGSRLLVRTDAGWQFELDPFDPDLALRDISSGIIGLDGLAGKDGEVVAYGSAGLRSIAGAGIAPLPEPIVNVAVIAADRIVATTSTAILVWDGQSWRAEEGHLARDRINSVSGDERSLLVVFDSGEIKQRDEGTRQWGSLGVPYGLGGRFRAALGLGAGRAMFAGQFGLIGIHNGAGFCSFQVEPNNLQALALSLDRRAVYWLESDLDSLDGDLPPIGRIELPMP